MANAVELLDAQVNASGGIRGTNLTVKVGKTVTWVNKDTVTHTVTSDGSSLFDSGFMPTGATFQFSFKTAGTYPYYCTVHPFMKGTIVVTP